MIFFFPFLLADLPIQGGQRVALPDSPQTSLVALLYGLLLGTGLLCVVGLSTYYLHHPPHWASRVQRLKDRPWASAAGLRALGILLLVTVGSSTLWSLISYGGKWFPEPGLWDLLGQSFFFHWIGFFAVVAVLLGYRWSWQDAFGLQPRELGQRLFQGLIFYLAALPFIWFYALLAQWLLSWLGIEPTAQKVAWMITDDMPGGLRVYLFLLAVVMAPVFEEMLFRGIGLPFLTRYCSPATSVLITSALFASVHFHWTSWAPLFVMAIAFSLAYIVTGSLWVPIFMHGFFNLVNVSLLLLLRGNG